MAAIERERFALNEGSVDGGRPAAPWYHSKRNLALLLTSLLVVVLMIALIALGHDDDEVNCNRGLAPAVALPVSVVTPEWVMAALDYKYKDGEKPANYNFPRHHQLIIYECDRTNASYVQGHIPHSVFSDMDSYEVGYPTHFLKDNAGLEEAARANGVCSGSCTVVVYARNPVFASRLWYVLAYMGVRDVRVMNGTLSTWVKKGLPVTEAAAALKPTNFKAQFVQSAKKVERDVEELYNSDRATMVDVRSIEEYEGVSSGSAQLIAKGRIPFALWGAQANQGSYTDADGVLLPTSSIKDLWRAGNINADSPVPPVFYCATGYRASLAYMYASLMGVKGAMYADGWWGWSTNWVHNASYDEPPTPGWEQYPSGRDIYP